MSLRSWLSKGLLCGGVVLAGCGEDLPPAPPSPSAAAPGAAPGEPAATPTRADGKKAPAEPTDLPPLPVPDINERDFLEGPTNRDPFKDFADVFAPKPAIADTKQVQRDVLVSKYALEELKVSGIVSGAAARVLVTDPAGVGWVLRVGDFVGRSEVIRSGGTGGGEVAVNWRLDRIRENDIVFVRETPDPSAPATTRVLSLRTQDELKQDIRTGIRGTRPDEQNATNDDDDKKPKPKAPPAPPKPKN
ncbi:MAG: pilus assembly protein PilP [Myxococcales bacterium]|nr:pilus assembly protein PilP [Myxococcales bacterium]